MRIAKVVSTNSKCLSRKIGAVLVKDKSIISTGYNGPAKGVKHCSERNIDFYINLFRGTIFKKPKKVIGCPRKLWYKSN